MITENENMRTRVSDLLAALTTFPFNLFLAVQGGLQEH